MSKEPTVPFGAAHRLPNEILQSIYGLLSPWEFQHARSTCHYWRQASLDSRLLTTQIRRGGWVGVLEGYTVTESGDIATLSRLLARECSLSAHADHGPDATASDNESHSPFRVTTTVDFSTLINRHEQVTYTLSVCKGYLLVAQDALVHLFSFQDLSLHFVTTLKFPDHVDLVSMDVSEGRYEVAALLQRAGTVMVVNPDCRSPAQDMRTSEKPQNNAAVLQASRSVLESPSGTLNRRTISSMYNKARNWARFRPRDRCLRERDPPASESSTSLQNVTDQQQDEPASEALSFMRRIRDLRLALTPSTSHSITDMFIFDPEQNIAIDEMVIGSKSDGIAFVITQSQAVQLYWEKYLLGEGSVFDLPCTCSRYGLYFVPRELLNDFERSWPNVSGSSTTVVLVSEVPPLEINLMPLSDGVNLLYTDLETHLLNLSYARFPSYLEMVAPECIATKRTVLIRGSADAAQFNENERRKPPVPTHYSAARDLDSGVRIAATYGDVIVLYSVPSDVLLKLSDGMSLEYVKTRKGRVNKKNNIEWMEWWSDVDSPHWELPRPEKTGHARYALRGRVVGRMKGVKAVNVMVRRGANGEGAGVVVWAFGGRGMAKAWLCGDVKIDGESQVSKTGCSSDARDNLHA